MTPSAAIVATLDAATAVTAIVGTRIYSIDAPDDPVAPYVVFQQIGANPGASHDGPTGATERMFQFACFASTAKGARALRDAVSAALDGVEIGNGDIPTLEDEREFEADEAAGLYRADADFSV